ncbi:MAG: hypothetical protein Q8922_06825 [Bacteroidota bacterium]|nr:hypothetical protein [Bacteroidota bacterium]MDP4232692.1 hypothetical protein [Bacteroidota bacterium]MDP4243175.1 hypothetical protein [Bacteroidota bacterium]MDP4287632.1 hypothetical protein [Bacteroidota bacterium]
MPRSPNNLPVQVIALALKLLALGIAVRGGTLLLGRAHFIDEKSVRTVIHVIGLIGA